MHPDASAWSSLGVGGSAALRRILAAAWGLALLGVAFLPALGPGGGIDLPGAGVAAARYQPLVLAAAGCAGLVGAVRGTSVWGWVMLAVVPLLVGLGLWEYLDTAQAWWQPWWQPALGSALVVVPAWLLLGLRRPADPAAG